MSKYFFPSDAVALLAALRGHKVVMVRRQVLLSDYNELPPSVRDEESDGPTEFVLDDGMSVHFVPDTEQMSVKVGEGRMPVLGGHFRAIEPSGNTFWAQRIPYPVAEVYVLVSEFGELGKCSEFAVELRLTSGLLVVLEYVSDEEHPDMLRISGDEPDGTYRRMKVS